MQRKRERRSVRSKPTLDEHGIGAPAETPMKPIQSAVALALVEVVALAGAQMQLGCTPQDAYAHPVTTNATIPAPGQSVPAVLSLRAAQIESPSLATALYIRAKRIDPPSRVAPNATVYVIWAKPPGGVPQNIGTLHIESNLTAALDTVSTYDDFNLAITPEANADVLRPVNPPIFVSDVNTSQ
jgi:hypothetical protein